MPEPTKTASLPSCIIKAASTGVAIPPAVKFTTESFPFWPPGDESIGCTRFLGCSHQLLLRHAGQASDLACYGSHTLHGLNKMPDSHLSLDRNVLIAKGSDFYVSPMHEHDRHVRVSYASASQETLETGFDIVEAHSRLWPHEAGEASESANLAK